MDAKLTIRFVDADHGVAIWERTLIQIWAGVASAEAFARMNSVARSMLAEKGDAATSLFIVGKDSPPPSDKARKELATFSRDIVSRMALAVVVAEGGGFRAALVRAVGITLTTFVSHRLPFKFVGDVEAALGLLAPHLSPSGGGVPGLRQAALDLRDAIAAHKR